MFSHFFFLSSQLLEDGYPAAAAAVSEVTLLPPVSAPQEEGNLWNVVQLGLRVQKEKGERASTGQSTGSPFIFRFSRERCGARPHGGGIKGQGWLLGLGRCLFVCHAFVDFLFLQIPRDTPSQTTSQSSLPPTRTPAGAQSSALTVSGILFGSPKQASTWPQAQRTPPSNSWMWRR